MLKAQIRWPHVRKKSGKFNSQGEGKVREFILLTQNFRYFIHFEHSLHHLLGVVGWCEGVVYLTSQGRPTDISLQLGKACYPCGR